eukprot:gene9380-11519_t
MLPGLLAVAVLPEDSALDGWPALRRSILMGSGIAAVLLVALATALFFIAWHSQRANALREAADARLRDAIESLPDGFVLWDAEDRLVICNSRYRGFYGPVAEKLVPGLRFEDLARAWIAEDMFVHLEPDADKRLAHVIETHREPGLQREREMRDGRWLRSEEISRKLGLKGMSNALDGARAIQQELGDSGNAPARPHFAEWKVLLGAAQLPGAQALGQGFAADRDTPFAHRPA